MKKIIAGAMGIVMLMSSAVLPGCSAGKKEITPVDPDSAETIVFGNYRDEDIQWIVLDTNENGDKFLITKYVIDVKYYNDIDFDNPFGSSGTENQSWEESTLRQWLNSEFIEKSFTEAERQGIKTTHIKSDRNSKYHTKCGSGTYDRVFILSEDEVKAYFATEDDLKVKPWGKPSWYPGLWVNRESYCNWWLRTPGCDSSRAACVRDTGYIYLRGYQTWIHTLGVRPAMWVNFDDINRAKADESRVQESEKVTTETSGTSDTTTESVVKDPSMLHFPDKDKAWFGNYGYGSIDWIVLDRQDDKALLITKDIFICRPYNESDDDTTWENCSLRKWLNTEFYDKAFLLEEKGLILTTDVVNNGNTEHNIPGGNNTKDKVFILSVDEAKKYFGSESARQAVGTYDPVRAGLYVDDNGYSLWWLRTPGAQGRAAAYVDHLGQIKEGGIMNRYTYIGVRPAIWVTLK